MKCLCVSSEALILVMVLLSILSCKASSQSISSGGGGRAGSSSMADSNIDLEFMMESDISRMLAASASGYAYDANRFRNKPIFNCGRAQRYCIPTKNPPSAKEKCGAYHRNCQS